MNIFKKLLLLAFIVFLFPNFKNEELVYDVQIEGISIITGNIGQCNLKFNKIDGEEYQMDIITRTTSFAKILYPYLTDGRKKKFTNATGGKIPYNEKIKINFNLLEKFYFFIRRKLESRKRNRKNY